MADIKTNVSKPKTTKVAPKTTSKLVVEEVVEEDNTVNQTLEAVKLLMEQNKKLEENNSKLQESLSLALEKINQLKDDEVPIVEDDEDTDYEEPLPNKSIKLISLYDGILNLSDGKNVLTFNKYGEIKNCTYARLCDICDKSMRFAEEGRFFITNPSAVYHLGLSDAYKSIQPHNVLENILNYDQSVIKHITGMLNETQKQFLAERLAKKIYYNNEVDLNKIQEISKSINIDIYSIANEMQGNYANTLAE